MFTRRAIQILLVSILLVALSACENPFNPAPSIVGTWRGDYLGSHIIIAFNKDGIVNIAAYGGFQNGTYTVNMDVTPNQIDLTFPETEPIHTIFELTDANTLKFENNDPGADRPTEFSDFFLLTRDQR